jgi:pyocin large subunit-like protein
MKIGRLSRSLHNLKFWFKRPPFTKGFRTAAGRADHFQRHNSKFGFSNEIEYEMAADRFCGGPIGPDTHFCQRSRDGARILYNELTNELGFVDTDGYITTYFKPTRKGLEYFEKNCS